MANPSHPTDAKAMVDNLGPARETPQPDRRIQAAPVRALCGDISDMTLWRWINERDFPKPSYIGRRRYWRERDVLAWLDEK